MEKFVENCKISQGFKVSRQILDKIGVQLCKNLYPLIYTSGFPLKTS